MERGGGGRIRGGGGYIYISGVWGILGVGCWGVEVVVIPLSWMHSGDVYTGTYIYSISLYMSISDAI